LALRRNVIHVTCKSHRASVNVPKRTCMINNTASDTVWDLAKTRPDI